MRLRFELLSLLLMGPVVAGAWQPFEHIYGEGRFRLHLHMEEKRVIEEIVFTVDESNTILLGLESNRLTHLGEQVDDIGILRFLGYIFSEPALKTSMRRIRSNWFKWTGFIGGLKPRADREARFEAFYPDVVRFAEFLDVPPDRLTQCARERDWKGFVGHLIAHS